ncbi:MAG: hypothetical protein ACRD9W_18150 [Terriglobia bacterium]
MDSMTMHCGLAAVNNATSLAMACASLFTVHNSPLSDRARSSFSLATSIPTNKEEADEEETD